MNALIAFTVPLIVVLAMPATLRSQAAGPPTQRVTTDSALDTRAKRETHDPLVRSAARSARPQLTALATRENKVAKGQLGIERQQGWGTMQYRASASTSLAEGTEPTTRVLVADISDLTGVNTGELGSTLTYWRLADEADLLESEQIQVAARKKVFDHLQGLIDAKEAQRQSTAPRNAENTAHAARRKQLDDALAAVEANIVSNTVIANDMAKPQADRDAARAAIVAAVPVRDGLLVTRDVAEKRHKAVLDSIATAHSPLDKALDRDIGELRAEQEHFKQQSPDEIQLVGDANPRAMMDSRYASLIRKELATIRKLRSSGTPLLFGFSVAGGRKKYNYLSADSLTAMSQSLTVSQVRFAAGALLPLGFFTTHYSRQQTVKEQDQAQLCRPQGGQSGVLQCANARLGAPTRGDKNLVGAEFRAPLGRELMVNIEITRDLTSKVTVWQVPFYFMPDKVGGTLNGGIVLGGQSNEGGLTVKAFVGAVAPPGVR